MKVFVVSDDKKKGISAANLINGSGNSGIISQAEPESYKDLVKEIAENKKTFDVAFVVTSKPIAVCTEANKLSGVRAAVCADSDDAIEAREAESNVIVISSSNFTEYIFKEILENTTDSEIATPEGKQESLMNTGKQLMNSIMPKKKPQKKQKQTPKAEEKEEEPEEEEEQEDKPGKKDGSVMDKLKDSLGIKG